MVEGLHDIYSSAKPHLLLLRINREQRPIKNAKYETVFIVRSYFKIILNNILRQFSNANTVLGLTYDILRLSLRQS